jgi:hypothetical protein
MACSKVPAILLLLAAAMVFAVPIQYNSLPGALNVGVPITLSPDNNALWTYFSFSLDRASTVSIIVESTLNSCIVPGARILSGQVSDTTFANSTATPLAIGTGSGPLRSLTLQAIGRPSGLYTLAVYGQSSPSCTTGTAFVRVLTTTPFDLPLDCGLQPAYLPIQKCDVFVSSLLALLTKREEHQHARVPIVSVPLLINTVFSLTSGSIVDSAQWSYATIVLQRGQVLTLQVARQNACLDVALTLFRGAPSDSSGLGPFSSNRSDATFVGFADDEVTYPGGPYGDPQLSVVATQDGTYTVGV